MISQNVWIGITIGIFFVGLGIGFVVFSNQSMNAFHNQNMFNQMTQNPDQMMEWMAKDPKHIEQMSKIMKEDHVFMSQMMTTLMNDPELRFQMIGHMSENPEALQQIMKTSGSDMTNSYAMNNNTDSMDSKMKDSSMTDSMMNHP